MTKEEIRKELKDALEWNQQLYEVIVKNRAEEKDKMIVLNQAVIMEGLLFLIDRVPDTGTVTNKST